MYNSPRQPIPPKNILKSHLSELEQAVMDADMFNIAERASVYEALDYIQAKHSYARHKCIIFKEILENHSEFQSVQLKVAYLNIVRMVETRKNDKKPDRKIPA